LTLPLQEAPSFGAVESLLPIGRFARLTGLTVKALRHYDEVGLLEPASVDPATGYRYYAARQCMRAEAIRRLRSLELPLEDVATLLDSGDPATIRRILVDHQRRTALRAAELNVALQGLQPLIDGYEKRRLNRMVKPNSAILLAWPTCQLRQQAERQLPISTVPRRAVAALWLIGFRSGWGSARPADLRPRLFTITGSSSAYTSPRSSWKRRCGRSGRSRSMLSTPIC
jgi:DNA-binding transcriptional MerR regulator